VGCHLYNIFHHHWTTHLWVWTTQNDMLENFLATEMCHLCIWNHVVPARMLPHPIHLGYPRILFGTFFKDISFLDSEKYFGLHYLMAIDCLKLAFSRYMQLCLTYFRQDFRKRFHTLSLEDYRRQHLTFGWTEVLVAKEVTWQTNVFKTWDILVSVLNLKVLWVFWCNCVIICGITLRLIKI